MGPVFFGNFLVGTLIGRFYKLDTVRSMINRHRYQIWRFE